MTAQKFAYLDRFPSFMPKKVWSAPDALRAKAFQIGLPDDQDIQDRFALHDAACNLFGSLRFRDEHSDETRLRAAQTAHLILEIEDGILARFKAHEERL
jgi:hypothetical protein